MQGVFSMGREAYDKLPQRLNWSSLKHMARSPAHFRHNLMQPMVDTDARKRGRATHLACFEPERFLAECVRWEGGTRRGKTWEAFCLEQGDKEILTEAEWDGVQAVGEAARRDRYAAPFLSGGQGEATMLWDRWGEAWKGRVDLLKPDCIVDLKTCRSADLRRFPNQALELGYFEQAAVYTDGREVITGKRVPYFIVAVEAMAPFVVQVYEVQEAELEWGRERYRQLLERLQECRKDNDWPGYERGPVALLPPDWARPTDDFDGLGLTTSSAEATDGL
jgi:hypothetical protein